MKPLRGNKGGMDRAQDTGSHAEIGLAIGMSLGLLFGIMFDQIGLGLAFGAAFGPFAELSGKKVVPKE